jgi:predicted ribosome quality control (RQC) complex YloA/Tae2 family protein
MRDLASIDFHFLVAGLAQAIGARIDKVYAPEAERLVLQLRKGGAGRSILVIAVPKAAFISSAKEEMPEKPSAWCQRLRNLLEGMKITAITQPRSERCIKINCAKQDASYDLYAEFFGKGNIVVVDKDGIAQAVLFEREFKDRVVAKGKPYSPPSGPDIFNKGRDDFVALLTEPFKGAVYQMLATKAALGQIYGKEVCIRASIDPDATTIDDKDAERLFDALHSLLESTPAACMIDNDPYPLKPSTLKECVPAASFSAAVEKSLATAPAPSENKAANALEGEATRLRKSIGQQESVIASLENEAQEAQRAGELIYERFQHIELLLKATAEARKKGTIKEFLAKHPEIKEYKQASGEIVVEF